jgi:hypothetical protein
MSVSHVGILCSLARTLLKLGDESLLGSPVMILEDLPESQSYIALLFFRPSIQQPWVPWTSNTSSTPVTVKYIFSTSSTGRLDVRTGQDQCVKGAIRSLNIVACISLSSTSR